MYVQNQEQYRSVFLSPLYNRVVMESKSVKIVRPSGLWVFAQMRASKSLYRGSFKNFIPVADASWEQMGEQEKEIYKSAAKKIRQLDLYHNEFKQLEKRLKKYGVPENDLNSLLLQRRSVIEKMLKTVGLLWKGESD